MIVICHITQMLTASALRGLKTLVFYIIWLKNFGESRNCIVTHHFAIFTVQDLSTPKNVTKGSLIYEQYPICIFDPATNFMALFGIRC